MSQLKLNTDNGEVLAFTDMGVLEFKGKNYTVYVDDTGDYAYGWETARGVPVDYEDLRTNSACCSWPGGPDGDAELAAFIDQSTLAEH